MERDEIDRNAQPAILKWDLSHLGDNEYDARLIKFPSWEDTMTLSSARDLSLPMRIRFDADFRSLAKLDFPYNDVHWPILSSRMLGALIGTGQFRHRLIKLTMVNDSIRPDDRYDKARRPKPNVEDNNFVAVQLLDHVDAMDWEKSDAQRDEDLPHRAQEIKHLVLKKCSSGFPPLFRLSAYPTPLFVSASARAALEKSGARGIAFQDLDDFRS